MSGINLGIIGGGQLGSMLSTAAKKLNIKTIIYSDDINAPAQNFSDEFIFGKFNESEKILEFINKVDKITYEFENIPYNTLNEINKKKPVLPKPSINRLIQHRLAEKDFVNKLNIRTTQYSSVKKESELESLLDFIPDEGSPVPDRIVAESSLTERIKGALKALTPREEEIIKMRFGIDMESTYTLDEIGKKFDLTRERIRQIEKKALEKLAKSDVGEVLKSFLE